MPTLNTSIAQEVTVNMRNIDSIPVSLAYKDDEGADMDLTGYTFTARLQKQDKLVKEYPITQTGNVVPMQAIFEDIQGIIQDGSRYTLLLIADNGSTFVHIIYVIYANNY
jgi:hypothetical protein